MQQVVKYFFHIINIKLRDVQRKNWLKTCQVKWHHDKMAPTKKKTFRTAQNAQNNMTLQTLKIN